MNILERVSISYESNANFTATILEIYDRVRLRAFEHFVNRGSVHGCALEDWLQAENEVILKPRVSVQRFGEELVVEVTMTDIKPEDIRLQVAATELLVTAKPVGDGQQVLRAIRLIEPIEVDSIEADYVGGSLRITALLAASSRSSRTQVA